MNKFFSFVALVLSVLAADLHVAKEDHMQNKDPGRCAWCAMETLGRTHGWKSLEGLVEANNRAAYRVEMIAELKSHKVKHEVSWPKKKKTTYFVMHQEFDKETPYVYAACQTAAQADRVMVETRVVGRWWIEVKEHWDTMFIESAVEKGLGVLVSLNVEETRHSVVLVGMDDFSSKNPKVRIVDSNYKPGNLRIMRLDRFLEKWNGFAIVIFKNNR